MSKEELQSRLDSLIKEDDELKAKKKAIRSQRLQLEKEIKQQNLVIGKDNKLVERVKIIALYVKYSYLRRYRTESNCSWDKVKCEGTVELSEAELKTVLGMVDDNLKLSHWLYTIVEDKFEEIYGDAEVSDTEVLNSKGEPIDLKEFNVSNGDLIYFLVEQGSSEGSYEEFKAEIREAYLDECDTYFDDEVME